MTRRFHSHPVFLATIALLSIFLSACTTETVEVTRIKILERRVIERVVVTVEVTRLHRVVETPKPTPGDIVPPILTETLGPTPSEQPDNPTPTATASAESTPRPTVPSARRVSQSLLNALRSTEQTLLALVQALNSNPLPIDVAVSYFDALRGAPELTIPNSEAELQSFYARYREQVEFTLGQSQDLYTHLVQIQSGEADQTDVSPIHLALAQEASSASTSAIQALIREIEGFLASQP